MSIELPDPSFSALCKDLEHFETPAWAAQAILEVELMPQDNIDPACGTGILGRAMLEAGNNCFSQDIHDWGSSLLNRLSDWLGEDALPPHLEGRRFGVFMNPPFSKACEFVEQAPALGARKVVCFQRYAWYESDERQEFWDQKPPNRIYLCGSRATCFRHDCPKDAQGNRYDPLTGKKLSSTPTAHAWFVWEQGHPPGTLMGRIYKPNDGGLQERCPDTIDMFGGEG